MAISLESLREFNTVDFRAPPPSPVAAGRRSSVANDEILSEYLQHSLRVPDLVLPDRVFPRQKSIQNPPTLDFQSLTSAADIESLLAILDSIRQTGCFEIVNHGISSDIIRSIANYGAGIFGISPEKKTIMSRSSERPYGFVEVQGEEERENSEEFVWCREEILKWEMEGIWPIHYSNFSDKMESLLTEIEKVAAKFLLVIEQNLQEKWTYDNHGRRNEELDGSICYLYKHCRNFPGDHHQLGSGSRSLKYDVIRMLIRGSEYSHALCLHICDGASEFHVYSKKGWVSFCPDKNALVVTLGDQLQAWSGGQYKHVIGRPIFVGEEEDCSISMAFLYSPPKKAAINGSPDDNLGRTISLGKQAIFVLLLTIFYHVFGYILKKF